MMTLCGMFYFWVMRSTLSGIKQLAQKGNTWTKDIQSYKNKIYLNIRFEYVGY